MKLSHALQILSYSIELQPQPEHFYFREIIDKMARIQLHVEQIELIRTVCKKSKSPRRFQCNIYAQLINSCCLFSQMQAIQTRMYPGAFDSLYRSALDDFLAEQGTDHSQEVPNGNQEVPSYVNLVEKTKQRLSPPSDSLDDPDLSLYPATSLKSGNINEIVREVIGMMKTNDIRRKCACDTSD